MSAQLLRLDQWSDFNLAAELERVAADPTMTSERAESILSQESLDADGCAAFVEKHGVQSDWNCDLLFAWLDQKGDLPKTCKNLEIAFADLKQRGLIETVKPEPVEAVVIRNTATQDEATVDLVEEAPATVVRRETGEVAQLNQVARDPRVPDIIRKNADQRLRLLVKTQIAQSRKPRLNEQVVII